MTSHSRLAMTLAALLLLVVPIQAEEDVEALLEVVRADKDPAAFDLAVTKLREMDSKTQYLLEKELQVLVVRYRKDLDLVNRDLDRLAGKPEESSKARKIRVQWEARRKATREFIADKDKFVDVFDRPMVKPGADSAVSLGSETMDAFNPMIAGLRKDLKQSLKLDAKAAAKIRERHFAARKASDRVAVAMGFESGRDEVRELPQFLLDLAEGDFKNAAERFSRLPVGRDRLRGFYAYSFALMEKNHELLGSAKASGAKGMASINTYRMSLGLSPLMLNKKLMAAADGHSREMKELNFYSNDSPTPGRKTEKERAALASYTDPVTQFIHTGSTITGALPVWMRSAIHHRLLTGTEFIEAGFGVNGPLTLVLGMGEKTTPPVLVY